jgi:type II secretory pathway component PulF
MNLDEFAFFNQQLAAMLRDGIPLEGAVRRLAADMHRGRLRAELELLVNDLTQGTPLTEALAKRRLPELYCRLLSLGARSENLPDTLTLVADYYQRQHALWTRLKGLLVYPVLLLIACFLLSVLLWQINSRIVFPLWLNSIPGLAENPFQSSSLPPITMVAMPLLRSAWLFPLFFFVPLVFVGLLWWNASLRQKFLDRLPAFREARLAQTAAAAELLLTTGMPLPEALAVLADFQPAGPLRTELTQWAKNIAGGVQKFAGIAASSRFVPPLFIWLVDSAGEDLRAGFKRAAEFYEERAKSRIQIMLYAALPVSVLLVGSAVVVQAFLITSMYVVFLDLFNSLGF